VRNKAQKWVFAALVDLRGGFPFPVLGIDSDYADLAIMPTSARRVWSAGVNGLSRSA